MKRWVAVDYWRGGRTFIRRFYTHRGAQRWWNKHPMRGTIYIEKRNP